MTRAPPPSTTTTDLQHTPPKSPRSQSVGTLANKVGTYQAYPFPQPGAFSNTNLRHGPSPRLIRRPQGARREGRSARLHLLPSMRGLQVAIRVEKPPGDHETALFSRPYAAMQVKHHQTAGEPGSRCCAPGRADGAGLAVGKRCRLHDASASGISGQSRHDLGAGGAGFSRRRSGVRRGVAEERQLHGQLGSRQ